VYSVILGTIIVLLVGYSVAHFARRVVRGGIAVQLHRSRTRSRAGIQPGIGNHRRIPRHRGGVPCRRALALAWR
jgi:hypothetical protein